MTYQNDKYGIVERNGQRIFGPLDPEFQTSPAYNDVKNHEVFLYNLPRDLFEIELLPFLCRIGPVYQIRFMMNFSGQTKSKAFVVFTTVEDAYLAVEQLNNQLIRPKHRVNVTFSINNRRLHLSNIPRFMSPNELESYIQLNGLTDVKILSKKGENQTFETVISFKDHHHAAEARRLFVSGCIQIDNNKIQAIWAKPKDFQTLFVLFDKEIDKTNEALIYSLFQDNYSRISHISYLNNIVFVKFFNFSMAYEVFKIYSEVPFPIQLSNGAFLLKVAWPERK